MIKTKITDAYGIKVPIIQAGMAFVSMSQLVIAASNAGGLGVLGGSMPPDALIGELRKIKTSTTNPFAVNFIPRFIEMKHIEICVEEKVPIVIFFWDEPPIEYLDYLKQHNIKIWVQVGSLSEAKIAVDSGADAVIVQGSEAGGHNRSTAATFSLLPSVVESITPVPVIAAGGIADGRGLAAALALGAEAVAIGTRLVASKEANAHDLYKKSIVNASVHDTARHNIFGYDFRDAPVRSLRNEIVREWEGRDSPPPYQSSEVESQPIVGETTLYGQATLISKYIGFPPIPDTSGDFEQMSLLAGESAGLVKDIKPAGEIITEIVNEAENIITKRLLKMTTN